MKIRPQKLVIVLGHGFYWNNVVGEVPIQVDSPEGRLYEGSSPRVFPTDREHTSIGTFMYLKISFLSFLHSFLLVFLNFPDLCLSSLCFLFFLIRPIKKSFQGNMGT